MRVHCPGRKRLQAQARSGGLARLMALLLVLGATSATAGAQETTAILADPADPYYVLAEEMAGQEGLPIVHSLDEVLARDPVFVLWVVSPARLSDGAVVSLGQAQRGRDSALSLGIITGSSLEQARALWQRVPARAGRAFAANAANPAAHVPAGIRDAASENGALQPLTRDNLVAALGQAGYLTYTGHGAAGYLRLDEDTVLAADDLPALPPAIVATGSCNTVRPWEEGSIALAFVDRGAAAYAGFAYSPYEGYLLGEFDGLPLRYTWPDVPIGHAVQVQNQGTLQGFASLPYYTLLGDPRLSLHSAPPYRLVEDRPWGTGRVQHYSDAPAGVIPVVVAGGARYSFVEIPGVAAGWEKQPFYNARLQMADFGPDKVLLVEQPGGEFTLRLRPSPPWTWVAGDTLLDALDGTLLFLQDNGGAPIMLVAGVLVLVAAGILAVRRPAARRALLPALVAGLACALLHGLYAWIRLDEQTITSKIVAWAPLSPLSTMILVAGGAFLFCQARTWRGQAVALAVALLPALAPAALLLALFGVIDELLLRPRLGASLWNLRPALQPLLAVAVLAPLLGLAFAGLRRLPGVAPVAEERQARATPSSARSDRRVAAIRLLLAANAALWLFFAILSLDQAAGPPAEAWLLPALMLGNALAMGWLAWVLRPGRGLWYAVALVVVGVNALLSVTDEFGLLDLVALVPDVTLLVLLLWARPRFVSQEKKLISGGNEA